MFNISIGNAHEFAPHPSLSLLNTIDMFLVNEEYNPPTNPAGETVYPTTKYTVLDKAGRLLFTVTDGNDGECIVMKYYALNYLLFSDTELSDTCFRRIRAMNLVVTDPSGEEVINVTKPCDCGCCCNCFDVSETREYKLRHKSTNNNYSSIILSS